MTTSPNTGLIAEHANGLIALGRTNPLDTPVPTCGDWKLADLLWHLTEVHHFWCHVIAGRPAATPATYDRPTRPDDVELPDRLESVAHELVALLDAASPSEPAWSWSDDHTVAFTIRRQTHEAIVHHLDGVLATGGTPNDVTVDPEIAADGIDELVTVMLIDVPDWAEYHPSADTVRLEVPEPDRRWDLEFGRMTGTSPDTGTSYDTVAFGRLIGLSDPGTAIAGPPLDLLLWLWGRIPDDSLTITGDPSAAGRLRDAVVEATA